MTNHTDLHELVYQSLINKIYAQEHKVGTLLPPIRDLAAQYGVSLNTVRLAYEKLEEEGYIKPIRKKGTLVLFDSYAPESREQVLRYVQERKSAILDVFVMLKLLVPAVISYGASLMGEPEIDVLVQMKEQLSALELFSSEASRLCRRFMGVLMKPTKNAMMFDFLDTASYFVRLPRAIMDQENNGFSCLMIATTVSQMDKIIKMVKKKQFAQLESYTLDCLDRNHRNLEKFLSSLAPLDPPAAEVPFIWLTNRYFHQIFSMIAFDLIRRIRTGEYLAGDFLPSEAELREKYSASTNTVRYALSVLERIGLVRKMQGKGTLVTATRQDYEVFPENHSILQTIELFFQSLQLAIIVSYHFAKRAAPRIEKEKILTMQLRNIQLRQSEKGVLYSPHGLLTSAITEALDSHCAGELYRQLDSSIYLRCLPQIGRTENDPTSRRLADEEDVFSYRAVDSLYEGRFEEFSAYYHNIWVNLGKIAERCCLEDGYPLPLPLPLDYLS